MYTLGWVSGTGGGISVKSGDHIYVAPSGVQKERVNGNDLFVLDASNGQVIATPANSSLRLSQCTPLFLSAYNMRGSSLESIHSPLPVYRKDIYSYFYKTLCFF